MFEKAQTALPRRRRTRRYAFLSLLMLALLVPIGWVAASGPTASYVVLFRDDAVTVPDIGQPLTTSSLAVLLAPGARPQPTVAAAAGSTDGIANRRVDPDRVSRHVHDITTRNAVASVADVYSAAVGGFSARLSPGQSAAIAADPSVAAVIPDEEVSLDDVTAAGLGGGVRTTNSPTVQIQPGIRRVGARSSTVTALLAGGYKINADVALLDTGIDRGHPDLNVAGGYNCTGRNRDKWDDDEGHGTHVAGIVGALDNRIGVTGVAPGVRLWSVKVLDRTGHGYVSWLVCGVDWVTAQRDRTNPSRPLIEVANMSLAFSLAGGNDSNCGRDNNDTLHQAICRSVDKGTVYVAAAGNTSSNVRRVRPAAYDEVITVSALADYDGRGGAHGYPAESCPYWSPEPDDAFASFSNYGPDVDLIAPGKCILSTFMHGRYAWMSGTSMATPHVSGAAVIYRTMFPKATPAQVRMALQAAGTLDWKTNTDPDTFHEKAVWIGQFHAMPDFSMGTSLTSAVVPPGSTLPVGVNVVRVGGFDDAVTVSLLNPPSGISATPIVTQGASATLNVRFADTLRLGRYYLTVSAAANDLTHTQSVTVLVRGSAPQATFTSPKTNLALQSAGTVSVAWSERSGGGSIVARQLDRQSGQIRTAGSCEGVTYGTESSTANATARTDHVRTGYCFRWVLTLTDDAGLSSTTYSGDVLVDTSAPRAPTVRLSGGASYVPDLAELGITTAFVSVTGAVWVRGGSSGTVAIAVSGDDPESGISRNVADVAGAGWSADWIGNSALGALRLTYDSSATNGQLSVSTVNGVGMAGASTTTTLMRDASAPAAAAWVSASSGTTRTIHGSYFKLDWTSVTDTGSGVATQQIVGRYRAGLNADGSCKTNGFQADGGFRLATHASWDSGLLPSYCYVWSLRTVDNVGNTSTAVVSGYVITEP